MKVTNQGLFLATAALLSFPSSAPARQGAEQTAPYARYQGAWFKVDYPAGWQVKPSLQGSTSLVGSTDSAFFVSPDKSMKFYVFAPQWNGDPIDIALKPNRENLVSHCVGSASRVKLIDGRFLYNPVANWYTVRAKDHSYQRSWVDVEDKGLQVRHVFGIQYQNQQAYRKYHAQYAHFCRSLEQFSD